MHLDAFPRQIEVAIILEKAEEACTEVFRFRRMLDIANNQAYDTEASDSTCVHLIESVHYEKLLHECDHVYHVRVLLFPFGKCGLGLDATQVLKGNIDVKLGKSILELDDGNLGVDDLCSVCIHAHVFEPVGCFVQQAFVGAPLRHVDNRRSAIVESIRNIHQVHVSCRQVQSGGERAKTEDSAILLWKPALTQCGVDPINKLVALFMLERLGGNKIVKVEDLVVKPSMRLVQ